MSTIGDDRTGPEVVEDMLGSTPEKERLYIETVALALAWHVPLERAKILAAEAVDTFGSLDATRENTNKYIDHVRLLVDGTE